MTFRPIFWHTVIEKYVSSTFYLYVMVHVHSSDVRANLAATSVTPLIARVDSADLAG